MKKYSVIFDRLKLACVYFTAVMILAAILGEGGTKGGASTLFIWSVLAFSIVFSFAGLVLKIKSISSLIKVTLHAMITMAAVAIIFVIVSKRHPDDIVVYSPAVLFALLAIILVLYIIYGIYLGIKAFIKKRKEEDNSEYKNQFKKNH